MNPTVKFGPDYEVTYTRDLCVLKAAGILSDAEFNLSQLAGKPAADSVGVAVSLAQAQTALAQALMQLHDRLPKPELRQ